MRFSKKKIDTDRGVEEIRNRGDYNDNVNGDVSGNVNRSVNGKVNANVKGNLNGSVNGDASGSVSSDANGSVKKKMQMLNGDVNGNAILYGNVDGNAGIEKNNTEMTFFLFQKSYRYKSRGSELRATITIAPLFFFQTIVTMKIGPITIGATDLRL